MPRDSQLSEWAELATLFFLHALAMGAWFVPLGTVLDAHHLAAIKPFAFATSAVAAFVSPLIFGAMADRHVAPVRVLRWLAVATAAAMVLAGLAIRHGAPPALVLALIQLHALCNAPTWGISTSIVLARLHDSQRQFGPIRAVGTFGWMVGCWIVSLAGADASTNSCFIGAAAWVAVALFSRRLPAVAPPKSAETITLRQRLGLDALTLLRRADHRVVFLAAALFSIPLAAFYPFTPTHLRQLGLERTTAWMTLGQITEIIAMVGLSIVLGRWPIKRTLAAGLAFGVLRYSLCALDGTGWVLAGLTLHGFAFTLFFITSQIYLDRRVDPAWRARAQALFSLMLGGVGNLLGYLGTGWWFQAAHRGDQMRWPLFWGLLAAIVAAVMVYFVSSYREEDRVAGRDTQAPVARRV